MNKKVITALGACALCLGLGVAGTLAWLTDSTQDVVNTFTTSNIDITLTESDVDGTYAKPTPDANSYKMIPGYTIDKDPKVTVEIGSEPCYVFVKITKSSNPSFDEYLTMNIDLKTWIPVKDAADVYVYKDIVDASTTKQNLYILNGGTGNRGSVTVKDEVTKSKMDSLSTSELPTLSFKAYATQAYKAAGSIFTADEAWANIGTLTGTGE